MELFFFPLSSFFLPQFFPSFLPTCLPHTPTPYTHLLCLLHVHFTICFIVVFTIITPPLPFCSYLLTLTFAIIAYFYLCAVTYFFHRHLLPPTFAIIAYSHHRHLLLPPYFHLLPPMPPLQVPHLLAYLVACLFDL
jgi:hypothetical protein